MAASEQLTILVVDDVEDCIATLEVALQSLPGGLIRAGRTTKAALQVVALHSIDAITLVSNAAEPAGDTWGRLSVSAVRLLSLTGWEQLTILVVDDVEDCIATLEVALQSLPGALIRAARTAEEALQVLGIHSIDAIIGVGAAAEPAGDRWGGLSVSAVRLL